MTVRYGRHEKRWAGPVAEALAEDAAFRTWILRRTRFAEFASTARLLNEEMLAKRSKGAKSWWASHFMEACGVAGLTL
jgi:hypothetical protein